MAVINFPSKDAVRSLAQTMMISEVQIDKCQGYEVPHYLYVLYGIIKQNDEFGLSLIGIEDGHEKILNDFYERLSERGISRFNFHRTIKKTFDVFSLV